MQSQQSVIDEAVCHCSVSSGLDGTRVSRRSALLTHQWHTVDAARIEPRLRRPSAFGTRSARTSCRGAAWSVLALSVLVSATYAQPIAPCVPGAPCFNPFAPGSPYEGCRTPVLDYLGCKSSSAMATAAMAELAVCMANVRAGFPLPVLGEPTIQMSAQQIHFCGVSAGICSVGTDLILNLKWVLINGVTSNDCWGWNPSWTGGCPSSCPSNPSASLSDRNHVKNLRNFADDLDAMTYLENVGPAVITFTQRRDFLSYTSGVYSSISPDSSDIVGEHSVMVFGFGTDSFFGDYWLAKGNFGGSWGERGYFRISRSFKNNVGFLSTSFWGTEGIACDTMCGGICGQMRHAVCNGRGTCETDGACTCDAGFSGSLCETAIVCGNGIVEAGEECDGLDDAKCPENCAGDCTCEPGTKIPAVSEWGLIITSMLLLAGGTVLIARRRITRGVAVDHH
ncbi:MAG: hypothetical protein IH989_01130 [Planctomycetes bacterium]|nr:hypothetical protein [Planctomycetota bacterium]